MYRAVAVPSGGSTCRDTPAARGIEWRMSPLLPLAVALLGCEDDGQYWVEAGGRAHLPANSRVAVVNAPARVELDVFLTSDRVPALWDGPRLDPTTCRSAAGARLTEDIWLLEHDFAELEAGFVCGGVADPAFPDAKTLADTLVSLDEALGWWSRADTGADGPASVALDLRFEPNVSHAPEVFAAEVLARWRRGAPAGTELIVISDSADVLIAVRERAGRLGLSLETGLKWPRVPPAGSAAANLARVDLAWSAGLIDPDAAREAAGADFVLLDHRFWSPGRTPTGPWAVMGVPDAATYETLRPAPGFGPTRRFTAYDPSLP